jgi:hypothetical protein
MQALGALAATPTAHNNSENRSTSTAYAAGLHSAAETASGLWCRAHFKRDGCAGGALAVSSHIITVRGMCHMR